MNPTEEDKTLAGLLLHQKPAKMLLALKSTTKYATQLAKESDCTYTHTLKILDEFQKYGLVQFNKEGRIKEVTLTDRGVDIAHELEGLVRLLSRMGPAEKAGDKNETTEAAVE
ncbi:Uncharacterised protein [uncultured archaeon]|nr:Uncharacterised protein [uncultured archaeon]